MLIKILRLILSWVLGEMHSHLQTYYRRMCSHSFFQGKKTIRYKEKNKNYTSKQKLSYTYQLNIRINVSL